MANRIQVRRDTAANWTSENPILAAGEPAYETDTAKEKIGDGSTVWTSLPYIAASTGTLDSVIGGTDITVDNTDPINPIVNFSGTTGGQVDSVVGGTDITVDATDPINPIVNFTGTTGGQVDSITAGTGIQVTGTATVPIVTADMTLQEVLDSGGSATVTDGTDTTKVAFETDSFTVDNLDGTLTKRAFLNLTNGEALLRQLNATGSTNLSFNEPVYPTQTIALKLPAPTTFDTYNLAVQVTDGVTTVDADTKGIIDISTLIAGGSGTVTSVGVSSSDNAIDITSSPITTSGTIDLALNVATTKTVLAYTEEEIDGTATEDAGFTGAESIDLSTHTDAYYTLTGNTTISVTNTPAVNTSFVRTWTIKSNTTEALALPVAWTVIGSYLATGVENYLTIRFSNYTTAGAKVVCYITQA